MLNEDVYGMALHLAGELTFTDVTANSDYRERAGYLIPVICRQCEGAENAYRRRKGLDPVSLPEAVPYSMRSDFPLSAPLATVAALGLASLLVADENPDLGATLQEQYTQSRSGFLGQIPAQCEPITDCYPAIWQ